MPACQISFSEFAQSLQVWCLCCGSPVTGDACPVCTPSASPAMDLTPVGGLVTQPAACGGECIRFAGAYTPGRSISHSDYRPDFALVHESLVGCGLDAPEFLPGGSHLSWSPIPTYAKADGYGAFMRGL